MANTEKIGANWYEVTLDGSADYTTLTAERFTKAYLMPSATGDYVMFAEVVPTIASSDNYPRKRLTSVNGGEIEMRIDFHKPSKLMIDISQSNFSTVGNARIVFEFK